MAEKVVAEKHCYKCNSYQAEAAGAYCKDGKGRRRFVCCNCLKFSQKGPSLSSNEDYAHGRKRSHRLQEQVRSSTLISAGG